MPDEYHKRSCICLTLAVGSGKMCTGSISSRLFLCFPQCGTRYRPGSTPALFMSLKPEVFLTHTCSFTTHFLLLLYHKIGQL